MRTEDLIERLAAEPVAPHPDGRGWLALATGVAVAVGVFVLVYGPRPDLARATGDPVVAAKTLLPLALAGLAFVLARRAARPGAAPGAAGRSVLAVPALAALLLAGAFVLTPAGERLTAFIGHSIHVCLPSIALLSAPILAGLLTVLRHGAPEHPARAGALAGLAAAGLATALYSLFCTEDSPLFYAVWYSFGIGIVALAGAAAGARVLRW
jgi:hypothetical protein